MAKSYYPLEPITYPAMADPWKYRWGGVHHPGQIIGDTAMWDPSADLRTMLPLVSAADLNGRRSSSSANMVPEGQPRLPSSSANMIPEKSTSGEFWRPPADQSYNPSLYADPWGELTRDQLNAIVANRAGVPSTNARGWSDSIDNPAYTAAPPTRIEQLDASNIPHINGDTRTGQWDPWTGKIEGGPIRPTQSGTPVEEEAVTEVDPASISVRPSPSSRKAIPQARAFMNEEARLANKRNAAAANVPVNPWDVFGAGGGDWARAWTQSQQKPVGIASALVGNQLNSFLNYGEQLNNQYNSPIGPYGQLQHAATQQRPYKAQENVAAIEADAAKSIADTKARTAMGLAGFLNGGLRSSPTAISTDYGASVTPEYRPFRAYRK